MVCQLHKHYDPLSAEIAKKSSRENLPTHLISLSCSHNDNRYMIGPVLCSTIDFKNKYFELKKILIDKTNNP
jgi:hypothetical protein